FIVAIPRMTARCPARIAAPLEKRSLRRILPPSAPPTGAFPDRRTHMTLTRYNFGLPGLRDEFKQAFEVLNKFAQMDEGDQSNVVTSQWAPRVDIKEEN